MRLYSLSKKVYYGDPPLGADVYKLDAGLTQSYLWAKVDGFICVSKVAFRRLAEDWNLVNDIFKNADQWEETLPIEKVFKETAMEEKVITDNVNHPKHYNSYSFEVIDIIEEVIVHFPIKITVHIGNVIKYILRAPFKGRIVEDLEKAEWYLHRAIEKLKESK